MPNKTFLSSFFAGFFKQLEKIKKNLETMLDRITRKDFFVFGKNSFQYCGEKNNNIDCTIYLGLSSKIYYEFMATTSLVRKIEILKANLLIKTTMRTLAVNKGSFDDHYLERLEDELKRDIVSRLKQYIFSSLEKNDNRPFFENGSCCCEEDKIIISTFIENFEIALNKLDFNLKEELKKAKKIGRGNTEEREMEFGLDLRLDAPKDIREKGTRLFVPKKLSVVQEPEKFQEVRRMPNTLHSTRCLSTKSEPVFIDAYIER